MARTVSHAWQIPASLRLPPHGGAAPAWIHRRVEGAWVQVAREAVGPAGRVVPQQWLSRTTAPQAHADDRRRLHFVVHGLALAAPRPAGARARVRAGVAPVAARRRKVACYPELNRSGPQRLVVLAAVWTSRVRVLRVGCRSAKVHDKSVHFLLLLYLYLLLLVI